MTALAVFFLKNNKVTAAIDNVFLLENRYPEYWNWLRTRSDNIDLDNDSFRDVEIFPISKIYINEITDWEYQLFLKDSERESIRRVIYFFDGTGIDVNNSTYGNMDINTWTITNISKSISSIKDIIYQKNEITDTTDIYEYLSLLKGHTFVISAMDDAYTCWNDDLQNLLEQVGLKGKFGYRDSYVAVVENGNVLFEKASQDQISYNYDGILINSAGMTAGNISNVLVNDMEYSKQKRGLNIVVFDNGMVVDSVNFDTWSRLLPCYR